MAPPRTWCAQITRCSALRLIIPGDPPSRARKGTNIFRPILRRRRRVEKSSVLRRFRHKIQASKCFVKYFAKYFYLRENKLKAKLPDSLQHLFHQNITLSK